MATKKVVPVPVSSTLFQGIDLDAHRQQMQQITQQANGLIAERVETIRTVLQELKEIVRVSGVPVNIRNIVSEFEDSREQLDPNTDWNSSSAYC